MTDSVEVFCEEAFGLLPHFIGKHVAGVGLDECRKILRHSGFDVGLGDGFYAGAGFFYRRAAVGFAKVEMKRAWGGEGGDVGGVAVFVNAGDKIRETMQQLGAVDAGVVGQAAIADQRP